VNAGNDFFTSVDYVASASVIAEGPNAWRVRPVAEVLFERDFGGRRLADGVSGSLLVGAIAAWSESWAFDVGLRHGRTNGEGLDEARLGFTEAFGGG
jgi:hypothetical protein